jgi:hypothetical protein
MPPGYLTGVATLLLLFAARGVSDVAGSAQNGGRIDLVPPDTAHFGGLERSGFFGQGLKCRRSAATTRTEATAGFAGALHQIVDAPDLLLGGQRVDAQQSSSRPGLRLGRKNAPL